MSQYHGQKFIKLLPNPAKEMSPEATPSIRPCPQCGTGVKFRVDPTSGRESCPQCGYVLPTQVAHFKLLNIIGTGGMGAVYRGLDTSLERQVAVKVMREGFAKDPQFVERFLREARAAAALNHPNVAQIYSFGEQNSRYYLVIELLPNGSLDDRIEKEHRLQELEVLDIGIQIASGLRAAYERGLIHRDIKPGNILFAQDGTAKVVDFGLARFEAKEGPQEEGIWGTPYYIAPEKISDHQEDFRSDIYSLGGTLFHALAGRPPFEAGTSTEVVLKHLHSPAVSLKAFAPDCTPQTTEVIGKMLKREPTERHQSYDELLNDLAYAKRFALEKKPPEQIEVESEFSVGILVSTLVVILLCITVGIYFWLHPPEWVKSETKKPSNSSTNLVKNTTKTSVSSKPIPKPPDKIEQPPINYAQEIENALNSISNGQVLGTLKQLEKIQKMMPENHALQSWVKLHIDTLKMLPKTDVVGKNDEAEKDLNSFAISSSENSVSPQQYPAFLAAVLLGKISGENFIKTISSLPEWMQGIAQFDAGLALVRQEQNWSEVSRYWSKYIQIKSVSDQSWVLSFQPMARDFVNEQDLFEAFEKQFTPLKSAGRLEEAQRVLKANQGKWQNAVFQTRFSKYFDENSKALAVFVKEQDDKRKAERAEQLEIENKLIAPMREQRKPQLLKAYLFDQILNGWKAIDSQIKTDENRKILDNELTAAQILADYRATIVKDVVLYPYDQQRLVTRSNRPLKGKLFAAHNEELCFRQDFGDGQYGETTCLWNELSPASVIELGDFYLRRVQKQSAPNEIARRALQLAVFCREFGFPESVIHDYLLIVKNAGANLKDTLDKVNLPLPAN